MEKNCSSSVSGSGSGWPEGVDWVRCYAATNNEDCFLLPWRPPCHMSAQYCFHGDRPPPTNAIPFEEDRAMTGSSSRSHSQAEKQRRERINAQLAALRKLIPNSAKMDKAALLGSVVDHVKDLKRKALEISKVFNLPSDYDEVTVDCDFDPTTRYKNNESIVIRASICCEDQPQLFSELIRALNGMRLSIVKADMACLGGRIKSIMVLCIKTGEGDVCINNLKQSLKLVLSRITSSSTLPNDRIRSKRQRIMMSSH